MVVKSVEFFVKRLEINNKKGFCHSNLLPKYLKW